MNHVNMEPLVITVINEDDFMYLIYGSYETKKNIACWGVLVNFSSILPTLLYFVSCYFDRQYLLLNVSVMN